MSFLLKNIIYWKLWLILTNQHYFIFSNINWHFPSIFFSTKYNSVFPKYLHLKIWIYEIICRHKSNSTIYYAFFLFLKYVYWFMLCNSSLLKWIILYIFSVGPILFFWTLELMFRPPRIWWIWYDVRLSTLTFCWLFVGLLWGSVITIEATFSFFEF